MAVTVTITSPAAGATINLPFPAFARATSDTGNIEAAWYQVDAGESINITFTPGTDVFLTFTLDSLTAGPHLLTVYARTASVVGSGDQNFTVASLPPPLPIGPPFGP
jgi:hypothetical protein